MEASSTHQPTLANSLPIGSPYGVNFLKGSLFKGVTWEGYPGRLPAPDRAPVALVVTKQHETEVEEHGMGGDSFLRFVTEASPKHQKLRG